MRLAIFAVLIPIYVIIYGLNILGYPYYAFWDSSMFFALDAMITRSGQLADHFFHPNMIPLVLNGYIFLPLGKILGFISVDSIEFLKQVQNPYLAFVEVVNFLLIVSCLFAYLFVALIYLSIAKSIDPVLTNLGSRWKMLTSIAIILTAITWGALPNMMIWIRYESYGLVFWLLSFLVTVNASASIKPSAKLFLAGVFAGAAFLSKIQLIGGALCIPFIYFALLPRIVSINRSKFIRTCIPVTFSIFIGCSILHLISYKAISRGEIIGVAFLSGITADQFYPYAPAAALMLFCIVCLISYFYYKISKIITSLTYVISIFLAGSFITIFCSLFLGTSWAERKSALEITYIFSLMFGQIEMQKSSSLQAGALISNLYENTITIIIFTAGLLFLGFNRVKIKSKLTWEQFIFGAVSIFILTSASALLLRNNEFQKDALIHGCWILIASVLIARMFLLQFAKMELLLIFIFIISLYFSVSQLSTLNSYQRKNYDLTNYQYQIEKWREFSYGFRQNQYRDLMNLAYPNKDVWNTAFTWSKNINQLQTLLRQIFRNANINLSDTSIGEVGGFLNSSLQARIKFLSSELQGSLIIPWSGEKLEIATRADFYTYLITANKLIQIHGNKELSKLVLISQDQNSSTNFMVIELVGGVITVYPQGSTIYVALKPK